jgi:hypothetical protein
VASWVGSTGVLGFFASACRGYAQPCSTALLPGEGNQVGASGRGQFAVDAPLATASRAGCGLFDVSFVLWAWADQIHAAAFAAGHASFEVAILYNDPSHVCIYSDLKLLLQQHAGGKVLLVSPGGAPCSLVQQQGM